MTLSDDYRARENGVPDETLLLAAAIGAVCTVMPTSSISRVLSANSPMSKIFFDRFFFSGRFAIFLLCYIIIVFLSLSLSLSLTIMCY